MYMQQIKFHGSASVRLLRLIRQVCAVQDTMQQLQCSYCCTSSTLKVHAHQRTGYVFFGTVVDQVLTAIDFVEYHLMLCSALTQKPMQNC